MDKSNLKNIFLDGENIYLKPLEINDIEGNYLKWLNDEDVVKYNSHGKFPLNIHRLRGYITSAKDSKDSIILAHQISLSLSPFMIKH